MSEFTIYETSKDYFLDQAALINSRLCVYLKGTKECEVYWENRSQKEIEAVMNKLLEQYNTTMELEKIINNVKMRKQLTLEKEVYNPFLYLLAVFNLDELEEHCLMVSLLPSFNTLYSKLFEYIGGKKVPTLEGAYKLFATQYKGVDFWQVVAKLKQKLFKYFIDCQWDREGGEASLYLKEFVLPFLLNEEHLVNLKGYQYFCSRDDLAQMCYKEEWPQRLIQKCKEYPRPHIFYIQGEEGMGKRFLVKQVAKGLDRDVIFIDAQYLPSFDTLEDPCLEVLEILRQAIIQQAMICFYHMEAIEERSRMNYLRYLFREPLLPHGEVWVCMEEEWHAREESLLSYTNLCLPALIRQERFLLWHKLLEGIPLEENLEISDLANNFKFTPQKIKDAAYEALHEYFERRKPYLSKALLYKACAKQNSSKLSEVAVLTKPLFNWKDLILCEEYKEQMLEACNQMKYRHVVFDKWEMESKLSYGKGLSILFEGPSGTGKTMAAQIMAGELGLQLYKVNLAQIVSKYVGETAKNLKDIFTEASKSNVILLLDETDALLGKRGEVKEAQDKYANVEVSFLLQQIEEYEGIVIMTTNYLKNIDEAFIRRIKFIIHFPFPTSEDRKKIWESLFPAATPVEADIDFAYLARQFEMSGGSIKNCVISAAFLAASQNERIGMRHLIKAINQEMVKQGKVLLREDFGEYFYLI